MPRRPRFELPGMPLHVTHRGVNRAATFLDEEDFSRYRLLLGDGLADAGVAIHGYVLMTNHVHLLLTPPAPGRVSPQPCAHSDNAMCLVSIASTDARVHFGMVASSPAWLILSVI